MKGNSALFTDLYELTMAQAYYGEGLTGQAVFSLFVRRLPPRRNFLLACGLDTVLDYLQELHFTEDDLAHLSSLGKFSDAFLKHLREFRFEGDVHAVPEGTPVFADEPILEVVAPLPQAQIAETFIMNQVHLQTVLASKAQRMAGAADGRPVLDFGPRRMHGLDAALKAARAFHIGGVAATSNVLASKEYGVPVAGTMAHSYIQAHDDETEAFRAFTRRYPGTVLLIDTYDTLRGVERVIELSREPGEDFDISAVRLDSGDLLELSRQVRERLDRAGLERVEIFASGGLDEDRIAELLAAGAPIDGFGVGTSMGVSRDEPDLDIAYKLCEYAGEGRIKLSTGKPVFPGRKQVFRQDDGQGRDVRDVIARAGEELPGRPLLEPVMRNGRRLAAGQVDIERVRSHAREQIARFPGKLRAVGPAGEPYPVEASEAMTEFHGKVADRVRGR